LNRDLSNLKIENNTFKEDWNKKSEERNKAIEEKEYAEKEYKRMKNENEDIHKRLTDYNFLKDEVQRMEKNYQRKWL